MDHAERLAAALGVRLFTTDLYIPRYKEGRVGDWKITHSRFNLARGYRSGSWAVSNMSTLLRSTGGTTPSWETWMSLSPLEVESQELGCRYARGYTVVMGLGMGWVPVNIALSAGVDRVTVVERDPEVIDLIGKSGALDELPTHALNKLQIVEADALDWRPTEPVDFLYADIWRDLAEPQALDEVRCMHQNVRADAIYYWGQELTIYAEMRKLMDRHDEREINEKLLRRCVRECIALPLLIPGDIDYAQMIEEVITYRDKVGA